MCFINSSNTEIEENEEKKSTIPKINSFTTFHRSVVDSIRTRFVCVFFSVSNLCLYGTINQWFLGIEMAKAGPTLTSVYESIKKASFKWAQALNETETEFSRYCNRHTATNLNDLSKWFQYVYCSYCVYGGILHNAHQIYIIPSECIF